MLDPNTIIFLSGFCLSFVLGLVIAASGFCAFGAIADWVSFGDRGRLGAWLLAITTAAVGVFLLQLIGPLRLADAVFPYTSSNFNPLRYTLGGFIF
ncbi:MAG: YeeE/YedE thiosulfate transporter family protein, partial [Pseudomonadota bacterium]